jgi:hypothetical protein
MAVAVMQSDLGAPGELDEVERQASLPLFQRPTSIWSVTSIVSRLDQDVAEVCIAGVSNTAAVLRGTTRVLAAGQSGEAHEAPGRRETAQVDGFGGDGHRAEKTDAAQRLQRRDKRGLPAVRGGQPALYGTAFRAYPA